MANLHAIMNEDIINSDHAKANRSIMSKLRPSGHSALSKLCFREFTKTQAVTLGSTRKTCKAREGNSVHESQNANISKHAKKTNMKLLNATGFETDNYQSNRNVTLSISFNKHVLAKYKPTVRYAI